MIYILIYYLVLIDSPLQLINNGHTGKYIYISVNKKWIYSWIAQLNLKNHYLLKHVALQSEDYKVEQIHFHWGHSDNIINGSEHLLDGQSYPLEVIINYLIKIFKRNFSLDAYCHLFKFIFKFEWSNDEYTCTCCCRCFFRSKILIIYYFSKQFSFDT